MRVCSACGKPVREQASFCASCGAPVPAAQENNSAPNDDSFNNPVNVPLITLSPQKYNFSRQRMLHFGKLAAGVFVVVALALCVAVAAAWLSADPLKQSTIDQVENEEYRKCLALVNDVRNDNFDKIIDDLMTMSGDMEDYNFFTEYERLFKEIIPDDSDPTAVKFRDCCYMVTYTEFLAKKYKSQSEGILGLLYYDKADKYRKHADKLWTELNEAQTDTELQAIMDYCRDNGIIWLKE